MIDNRILQYLDDSDEFKLVPEFQIKFRKVLLDYGVQSDSAIIDLMCTYAGEFNGKIGFIINVAEDLNDFENSVTRQLIEKEKINPIYISLFNFEFDDYLLYNIKEDSVVLIDGGNFKDLVNNNFSDKWNSFNEFLLYYFSIS